MRRFTRVHRDCYAVKSYLMSHVVGYAVRGSTTRRKVNLWLAVTRRGAVLGKFTLRKQAIEFLREEYTTYSPAVKGF